MAKFLYGNELNLAVEKIFTKASEELIIISPFIKLHARYKDELKEQLYNENLDIIIVFGKNENAKDKSMGKDDIEFFKQFKNVEIRYEKRLHAKYFSNDKNAIITSMNLYDFSQDNNIETGILLKKGKLLSIDTTDADAYNYFLRVIENSELIYKKSVDDGIEDNIKTNYTPKKSTYSKSSTVKSPKTTYSKSSSGFCIKCKTPIKNNPKVPYCSICYKIWKQYEKKTYEEKYCHSCGKSNKSSMAKPICYTCYKKG